MFHSTFTYECPACHESLRLPTACAGKQLTCSCGHTSTIRNLTPAERRKTFFFDHGLTILAFAMSAGCFALAVYILRSIG